MTNCKKCNGGMVGDGYTTVLHCEDADPDKVMCAEPDADPVLCNYKEDTCLN